MARAHPKNSSFAELFDVYYDNIYAYAFRRIGERMAAEDVTACTFEDALRGMRRLRRDNPPDLPLLYRIASRRVIDYYRKAKRQRNLLVQVEPTVSNSERLEQTERELQVRGALARLSPHDQELILLAFFEQLDAREIAAVLRVAVGTVYVRLHRALRRLQAILEREE